MHRHITEAVRLGVLFIGGRKRRPEEIFKFRVSEMPFPGLWGSFDRMRMVRKKRFSGQPDFLNMLILKKLGGG